MLIVKLPPEILLIPDNKPPDPRIPFASSSELSSIERLLFLRRNSSLHEIALEGITE